MLCKEATVHQKPVRCPQRLSSEQTCSFMYYKVVIYVFKIALAFVTAGIFDGVILTAL